MEVFNLWLEINFYNSEVHNAVIIPLLVVLNVVANLEAFNMVSDLQMEGLNLVVVNLEELPMVVDNMEELNQVEFNRVEPNLVVFKVAQEQ